MLVRTVLSTLLPVSESTTDDFTMEGRDCSTGRLWTCLADVLASEYKADSLQASTTIMKVRDCSSTRVEVKLAVVLGTFSHNFLNVRPAAQRPCRRSLISSEA